MNSKPYLLLDMDWSTINFQKPLIKKIQETTTLSPAVIKHLEDSRNRTRIALRELFDLEETAKREMRGIIEWLYQTEEFFKSLEPYDGIVDTIHDLESDFNIDFCTKPSKKVCGSESAKRETIVKYFGKKYSEKMYTAHDKTRVHGDLLIDDNPTIKWDIKPSWKQILVDQPHNQDSDLPRLYLDKQHLWKKQLLGMLNAKNGKRFTWHPAQ